MSERWPGGIVRSTPVTPTGPLQNGTAPGIWTMEQAAYWTKQGLWPTAGNFLAVEDVFSTWLYTGTGSTQTITNGINLSGQGGLVWFKSRTSGIFAHQLYDTVRGATIQIGTNSTSGNSTNATGLTAFTSSGFTIGSLSGVNSGNMASWTFREAPKFFDVVTYTGNGVQGRTVAHSLGVAPGMIAIKRTDVGGDNWLVYHRSIGAGKYLLLNSTNAENSDTSIFNNTAPTATEFSLGNYSINNASGGTYVAYLYAHDTSSTGIIQCGSFTTDGSGNATTTLGWEPQWVLIKPASGSTPTGDWKILDNMRGYSQTATYGLFPNASSAESLQWDAAFPAYPTATGMYISGTNASTTFIYIAIRRGPMRTPTLGTSVFAPVANTGNSTAKTLTTNFVTDLTVSQGRNAGSGSRATWWDRLRGPLLGLQSVNTTAETSYTATLTGFDNNTGVAVGADGTYGYINLSPDTFATWHFRRAPSFFDEVCYAGVNATLTLNHNLGVAPELIIVKNRTSGGTAWPAWSSPFSGTNDSLYLNTTAAKSATGLFTTTPPTSTTFTVGNDSWINASGYNYVAYLFASCPGVSKVGSYTGTGALQTINCGFTTGARFVLIKRTDSTGDWFVWDSARGITSGNDPYLLLNSTAAEVTGTNYVDTDTTGFQVTAAAPAGINANGGSYIFLAVA